MFRIPENSANRAETNQVELQECSLRTTRPNWSVELSWVESSRVESCDKKPAVIGTQVFMLHAIRWSLLCANEECRICCSKRSETCLKTRTFFFCCLIAWFCFGLNMNHFHNETYDKSIAFSPLHQTSTNSPWSMTLTEKPNDARSNAARLAKCMTSTCLSSVDAAAAARVECGRFVCSKQRQRAAVVCRWKVSSRYQWRIGNSTSMPFNSAQCRLPSQVLTSVEKYTHTGW